MPGIETVSNGDDDESHITAADVVEHLLQQFVIISGGKSKERCPIITFPDNGLFHTLSDDDYKKLVSYMTSVPSLHEADIGFVLVVDRRNDKWSSVKHILFKLTEFFPGLIHVVYVIRPAAFLQKAISEVSNKFFKEDFKFKVVFCNTVEELHQYIDRTELTDSFSGDLPYNHEEWIKQRIAVEQFSAEMRSISRVLDEFTQYVHDSNPCPQTVDEAVCLLEDHSTRYQSLKESIVSSSMKGEEVLTEMKHGNPSSQLPRSAINNISAVERLLVQLDETEKIFDEFWEHHAGQLKQCLELRTFENDYENYKKKLSEYLEIVSNMNEMGKSVEHVDLLIEELNRFHSSCQVEIEKSEKLMRRADDIVDSHRYVDVESIEQKTQELRIINRLLAEKLLDRINALTKARLFQLRIRKANNWCAKGIEMLGSQNIEKHSMFPEKVEQTLSELEHFVASADSFNVSGADDLYVFQDCPLVDAKHWVTEVLQRIEDVTVMCEKRITNLRRLLVKPNRPGQTTSPEIIVTTNSTAKAEATAAAAAHQPSNGDEEKENESCFTNGLTDESIDLLANGIAHESIIEFANIHTKQYHILKELLDTEKLYVKEMKSILSGYRDAMYDCQTKHLVPEELVGKENTLFCNIEELCRFHGNVFLPQLSSSILDVGKVADLFLAQKNELLRLYSYYCQNVIKSDKLREKIGERNEFFLECQRKLGHKLPLAAYMLKPVQRITKYQLLLKDLISNIEEDKYVDRLQLALDTMLLVLKCVNDRMHSISITGFKGDVSEQGDMLLQASFSVWVENKKDILKELRLKPMRRHIFLFRKAMIFCKKTSSHTKAGYQFKGMLKMSKIGLTETVKGDPKKFEVWLEGRQEIYIIQAATIDQKDVWVREIKKVLFEQLTELKGEQLRQYGEKWAFRTISLEGANSQSSGCSSRGTSRPNSHHEITDDSSSGSSNSEDEDSVSGSPFANRKCVALADYCASGQHEVSLKEGDKLEALKCGNGGWLYVRLLHCGSEGWVPASYLEPREHVRKNVRSVASSSSQQSFGSQHSADIIE